MRLEPRSVHLNHNKTVNAPVLFGLAEVAGAGAVNQAMKGLAQAGSYVAQRGLSLANRPGFLTVEMDGEERTAMVFYVFTV